MHVFDADASMYGALESLFHIVGLRTRTCAAAGDFLVPQRRRHDDGVRGGVQRLPSLR